MADSLKYFIFYSFLYKISLVKNHNFSAESNEKLKENNKSYNLRKIVKEVEE